MNTQRLCYIIRREVEAAEIVPGMEVEVLARELAEGFVVFLGATIAGTVVEIDAPANRFHALLYALGLPYRKRVVEVSFAD